MTVSSIALIASLLATSAYITYKNIDLSQTISSEIRSPPNTAQDLTNTKIDINEFLIGVIENFKNDMVVGIPELHIPVLDPFVSKRPIKISIEDRKASVQGNFTDVHIEGLSSFIMDDFHADLKNLSLAFRLSIPKSKAYGLYTINGTVFDIIPLKGNGKFTIEPQNLFLSIKACLENSQNDHLQLSKDFEVEMDYDVLDLHVEKIVGADRWDEVLETLNTTKEELFKKCLPMIKGELTKSLFKVINMKLQKLPITSIVPGSTADEYVDQILKNVRYYLIYKDLDPLALPDYTANFTKRVMLVPFNGEARMYDGHLFGISTLHRTDRCKLKITNTTITVSANLGVSHLRFFYRGHAKFLSFGPAIKAKGNIEKVSFYFKIQQSNMKGAKPALREFEIVEMSTISIAITGLGPLNWIMNWLLWGISAFIDDFMYEKMTDTIRSYIQDELRKYSFPL